MELAQTIICWISLILFCISLILFCINLFLSVKKGIQERRRARKVSKFLEKHTKHIC